MKVESTLLRYGENPMDKKQCMLEARILQAQGYTQMQIAQVLGVTDRTVRAYLKARPCARKKPVRRSKLDPFKAFLDEELEKNPSYNGELLYERIVAQGYRGKKTVMKAYVAALRRKLSQQAVLRFETEPWRQAQVDWKEFGRQRVDGHETKLYAFVMVLGYSRMPFVRFTTDMRQSTLLACHALAFEYFGGVPHEILYDNMRAAISSMRLSPMGQATTMCSICRPSSMCAAKRIRTRSCAW